jgi:diguanylate cyclase (GGDEF)-like protein
LDVYESILKNTATIFLIVNPDGIIIDTNRYTMDILDDSSLVGKYFYALVDKNTETSIRSTLFYKEDICLDSNFKTRYGMLQPASVNISIISGFLIIMGFVKCGKDTGIIGTDDIVISNMRSEAQEYENKRSWQVRNIDPLTGLYTKEFLKYIFEIQYNKALSTGGNDGIICFDIDNLSEIEDEYGEDKANRIMVGFSQVMLTSTRSTDYCIRYDNKFLLLVNNINRDNMKKISERITNAADKNLGVAVKSGIACTMDNNISDKWDLIKLAYENVDRTDMITD